MKKSVLLVATIILSSGSVFASRTESKPTRVNYADQNVQNGPSKVNCPYRQHVAELTENTNSPSSRNTKDAKNVENVQ